eukprot:2506994-Amphidinium_carterae.2
MFKLNGVVGAPSQPALVATGMTCSHWQRSSKGHPTMLCDHQMQMEEKTRFAEEFAPIFLPGQEICLIEPRSSVAILMYLRHAPTANLVRYFRTC